MALYAFDGTSNIDEVDDIKDTNVVRFKELYQGDIHYIEGVGTRFGALGKVLGGLLGMGGRSRIDEMLDELAENYPNDKVVDVIGYSRGAALAVHFCNKLAKEGVTLKDGNHVIPEIRFLGLWDVVGSFGLSFNNVLDFQEINIGWDIEDVPKNVETCRHAMAMDERREAFNVTRLNHKESTNLSEVWFKGVHGDVGGGNSNVKRSNIALNWMLDEASKAGVEFDTTKRNENKYASFDWDSAISENKDIHIDPKRKRSTSDLVHESALARELGVGESQTVNVLAKDKFNWTRVKLKQGHKYKVWSQASDKWKDDSIECNAKGWKSEELDFLKETAVKTFERARRCPEANWFELVGAYDNDEKTEFFRIGLASEFTAKQDGELYLFANDLKFKYDNNSGVLRVFVERLS